MEDVSLTCDATDREIWSFCVNNDAVLITSDRSENDGEDSLGWIVARGAAHCRPVITIGDPNRAVNERSYSDACAFKLLDYLSRIDELRGVGRIYLSP